MTINILKNESLVLLWSDVFKRCRRMTVLSVDTDHCTVLCLKDVKE